MTNRLDDMLEPGERVVYRTPRPWPPRYRRWHGLAFLAFGLGLFGLDRWTAFAWSSLATPTAFTLLIWAVMAGVIAFAQKWKAEAAVTDRRVLGVSTVGGKLLFRSVDLEEIGEIEVLCRAVRVTKTNGRAVAIEHAQYAPEIALAAAQAAGRPSPWVPGLKGKIATHIADYGGAAACVSALLLQGWALLAMGLTPIPFPQLLLMLVPVFFLATTAWLAAEPLGMIALRPFYGPAEMRTWMRYYTFVEKEGSKPDRGERVRRLRLRYFNLVAGLLYGRAFTQAGDGAARHGG